MKCYDENNNLIVDDKYNTIYHTGVIVYDNGIKCWYKNGFYFRENGPAIIRGNGSCHVFFMNGQEIQNCNTIEEYNFLVDIMKLKGLL